MSWAIFNVAISHLRTRVFLFIAHPSYKWHKNVQIPRVDQKNNEKLSGALRGIRVAKGDCTGAVSTRVCQRAGIVAVYKLLYNKYKVGNKVVFQNTPTRGPALLVMAARLQDTQP